MISRLIVGALFNNTPHRLKEADLHGWFIAFAGVAWGPNIPADIDPVIVVEGEHEAVARQLGKVELGYTSTLALQSSIEVLMKHPHKTPKNAHSIALGIGTRKFCMAHLVFFGLTLPEEMRGSITQLIQKLEEVSRWDAVWFDTASPDNLYLQNLMEAISETA